MKPVQNGFGYRHNRRMYRTTHKSGMIAVPECGLSDIPAHKEWIEIMTERRLDGTPTGKYFICHEFSKEASDIELDIAFQSEQVEGLDKAISRAQEIYEKLRDGYAHCGMMKATGACSGGKKC